MGLSRSQTRQLDSICSVQTFLRVKTIFTNKILREMPIYRTDEAGDAVEAGDQELRACLFSLMTQAP